jgi:uncharacterized membrane protein YeaQ/YmgE (transglycosylase-associated protein family)
MSVAPWICLGVVSGLVAGRLVSAVRLGILFDIVSGLAVASAAGALAYRFAGVAVTAFNFWSLTASMTSAVVLLAMHNAFMVRHPIAVPARVAFRTPTATGHHGSV